MYLLQSMLYMHIVTLYVLQITVTFTNETISKFTGTLKHISILTFVC